MTGSSPPDSPGGAPLVSIVIPTFNRSRDIGRCLDSLVAQTFRDFEVLICDDGSVDDTAEVVNRYKDRLPLAYHWAENFGGPARPRNLGVRLARGTYVAFLDSDDWWAPEKLAESVAYLERGADLVYHDLHLATRRDQNRYWRKSISRELRKPVADDLLANGNGLNNSSVVVRRALMDAIGGFSEARELIAVEDYDAWVRIAKVTDGFVRIPRTLGYYWVGDGNLSNPRRTVTTTEALEKRYSADLAKLSHTRGVSWTGYCKARSYYLMGAFDLARTSMGSIDWSAAPWSIRARCMWMRAFMMLSRSHAQGS